MSIREQKKRQTRQSFYDAVLTLCLTGQSFSSISLRQVTREVGVVPTAFYRHFADMEDLGRALVEDELGQALAILRDHMHLGKKRSFERQIAKSVQLFFDAIDVHPKYWQFIASERFGGSEAVRHAIATQIELFADIMAKDLALQPAFAHINAYDRRLLAITGVNMSFSWIIDWIELNYAANHIHDNDAHDNGDDAIQDDSMAQDTSTFIQRKEAMLHDCTRQTQMLYYGAYNWQSHEETVLDERSL